MGSLDTVETNTGIFVDPANTGTDPHNSDTDGDGFSDGEEVAGGSNPNDANSTPNAVPALSVEGALIFILLALGAFLLRRRLSFR